jgi:hypothetical protein
MLCDFFLTFIFENNVNVPQKSNKQRDCKKLNFLLASQRSVTNIAGSASGSPPKYHGSATLVETNIFSENNVTWEKRRVSDPDQHG